MTDAEKKLIVSLAGVMVTLAGETGPVPASSIYLAMSCDMAEYQALTGLGSRMGWLRVTATTVALTPKGHTKAAAFATAFAGAK